MRKVFLGGTVGSNNWREGCIEQLVARRVPRESLFNPVVQHWDDEARRREDEEKADPNTILLFYIGSPDPSNPGVANVSPYSLGESIMNLYDQPDRTVVVFDLANMDKHTTKGLRKLEEDLRKRFQGGPIFDTLPEAIDWLAKANHPTISSFARKL